jgi:hypothetical protein
MSHDCSHQEASYYVPYGSLQYELNIEIQFLYRSFGHRDLPGDKYRLVFVGATIVRHSRYPEGDLCREDHEMSGRGAGTKSYSCSPPFLWFHVTQREGPMSPGANLSTREEK